MAEQLIDTTHTATGQMAGYLFQPDRALVLLCSCNNNESVSIELVDDVAMIDDDGNVIFREQDKSSIQAEGQPFKDRSKDLWNTLMIWATEIKNGTLKIETTKLVCVTNKKLDDNSLIKKISSAKTEAEVTTAIALLKTAAAEPPAGLKKTIETVLAEEEILKKLIPQITLIEDNNLETRNKEIADELHLSDEIKNNVIESLRGWLNESILKQLERGQAPIIKKTDFNNRYHLVINKETDDRIVFMAKRFVKSKISQTDREEASDRTFVKQLDLVGHSDKHNILLDAIDDFLCSEAERTRLTIKGDLDREELNDMDELSKERWTEVFRRKMTQLKPDMKEDDLAEFAFEIYDTTVSGYLAEIRGNKTQPYFTKGSFHKLSDELEIGWHPHWQKHFPKE
jgi:ABC-3C protein